MQQDTRIDYSWITKTKKNKTTWKNKAIGPIDLGSACSFSREDIGFFGFIIIRNQNQKMKRKTYQRVSGIVSVAWSMIIQGPQMKFEGIGSINSMTFK